MKTPEELNALKEKAETLNKKLAQLTEEELAQVSGGNSGVYGGSGTGIPKPDLSRQKKTYGLGSTDLKEFDCGSSYTSSILENAAENAAENLETKLHQNYENPLKQQEEELNRKLQELMSAPPVFHILLQ